MQFNKHDYCLLYFDVLFNVGHVTGFLKFVKVNSKQMNYI